MCLLRREHGWQALNMYPQLYVCVYNYFQAFGRLCMWYSIISLYMPSSLLCPDSQPHCSKLLLIDMYLIVVTMEVLVYFWLNMKCFLWFLLNEFVFTMIGCFSFKVKSSINHMVQISSMYTGRNSFVWYLTVTRIWSSLKSVYVMIYFQWSYYQDPLDCLSMKEFLINIHWFPFF